MGLITHNRIYVCIGASPCPVSLISSSSVPSDARRFLMSCDLPPRHRGSRCHLHALLVVAVALTQRRCCAPLAAASTHYPRLAATALVRQPLWAGDAASCGHLVCRPAHMRCARKRPPLQVGTVLHEVLAASGPTALVGDYPYGRLPLQVVLAAAWPPLQVTSPQVVIPCPHAKMSIAVTNA
ncbi:hypothetical protein GW17_00057813 [Ensete ventricosum]|nr:hypothetical protein GW17_00057813 [Ensete ventricosum]RZS09846.1 hypothetical protein BHM03_00040972 [Ensete ventricosum]